ncbi:MAG: C39 family peptidase [Geminicoccaceae bacterium]
MLSNTARRLLPLIAVCLFFGLGATNPSSAQERSAVRSLLEIRQDKVILQNWDLSCGAAALATLLNFQHGEHLTERTVAKGLMNREEYLTDPNYIRYRHGFSLLDLKRYVDQLGYEGVGLGQLDLDSALEKTPIMVPVRFNGYNHFVILRGVHGNRVLLADPAYGNRTMPLDRFEEAWLDYRDLGHVGFVIEPRGGRKPPNRLAAHPRDFPIYR